MTQLPAPRHTERKMRQLERLARQQGAVISCITKLMEVAVANQDDLMAKIAELKQAVADDQASDQAVVTTLDGIIAALRASGDTSAAIAALEDVKSTISTVTSAS